MEIFKNAKAVRLRSAHNKYLTADDDEESVVQHRNGSSKAAAWTVEFVDESFVRLKSCHGKYLTASNHPFLLGMTGRKVQQTLPKRLDSSLEWEPVSAAGGGHRKGSVMLKTRYGQYLRGNGGLPPWRNSVTHDVPHRTATKEWVVWEVDVVEILVSKPPPAVERKSNEHIPPVIKYDEEHSSYGEVQDEEYSDGGSLSSREGSFNKSANYSRQESTDSSFLAPPSQLPKHDDGRFIYFHIADENGKIDQGFEELCITFTGNDVNLLRRRLEVELGIAGITVCTKSPLNNGKLFPLRLQLPPNNMPMHVVVVPPSSNGVAL